MLVHWLGGGSGFQTPSLLRRHLACFGLPLTCEGEGSVLSVTTTGGDQDLQKRWVSPRSLIEAFFSCSVAAAVSASAAFSFVQDPVFVAVQYAGSSPTSV